MEVLWRVRNLCPFEFRTFVLIVLRETQRQGLSKGFPCTGVPKHNYLCILSVHFANRSSVLCELLYPFDRSVLEKM